MTSTPVSSAARAIAFQRLCERKPGLHTEVAFTVVDGVAKVLDSLRGSVEEQHPLVVAADIDFEEVLLDLIMSDRFGS